MPTEIYPVQLYICNKTYKGLFNGQYVFEFSDNKYYQVDIISRGDVYEIRKLRELDRQDYEHVLTEHD